MKNQFNKTTRRTLKFIIMMCILVLLSGCIISASETVVHSGPVTSTPPNESFGFTAYEIEALSHIRQVDEHPLFVMVLNGPLQTTDNFGTLPVSTEHPPNISWGCSLFAALGDPETVLFGRNFDWQFSPALLLFTNPPDGYASVSMVDIAYLLESEEIDHLLELDLNEKAGLLEAPYWPFDGMNEKGVAIGMAAVPPTDLPYDEDKETINSLLIMRKVLDHAASIEEALEIFERFNIDMGAGPHLHYFITDSSQRAVVIEFIDGKMHTLWQEHPWHTATNYLLAISTGRQCGRYEVLKEVLMTQNGQLDYASAMNLLSDVSQSVTQWSILYDVINLKVQVAMSRKFDNVHKYSLPSQLLWASHNPEGCNTPNPSKGDTP